MQLDQPYACRAMLKCYAKFCQFHVLRQSDSDVAVCFEHYRLSHENYIIIYIRTPEYFDLLQCCSLLAVIGNCIYSFWVCICMCTGILQFVSTKNL